MAEITFDGLNENSLIMQWNTDNYGNPKSIHINNEVQQVSVTHHIIQLAQIPDEYYRARFVAEGINGWLIEVRSLRELKNINNYYVDYNHGIVYFHEEMAGRLVRADYYGRGVMFLSDTRIFHKSGDSFATTLDEVLEKSEDAFKLLESTGGLNQAIELLEDKAEEGNKVADRLQNFITETQFYGYTIVLSREAFVVRAKEDGNLHNGEMEDLTVDVVVYKGAKNLSAPDLDVRLYSTTNCECEIENQKLTVTRIDVDCIQAQAIIEIDCGDGLIAYRTIEITKVFDGVSQFNVEMTNAFHSFSATHSGKIEEEQSVTCEFTVTKANEEFKGYVVGIQNVPSGITHNLKKPTENASSVTFTAQPGTSLPDNASISVVFQFNDYVITKTFAFTKSKQGLSAKSLRLAGNQIIHYENPNYEGTPNPTRTSIIAQVTDLNGTPVWSYLEGEEWIVIDGQNGTNLNLYHNDRIWGTKHELTIKCELDGFSDEITLIKIANGAMGLSSYSVILSNESTTLRVGLDGKIPTEELTSQYTRVTAFKGADQITPTSITVPQGDNYEVSVSGSTINLIDVDASTSTVNIPIEILLDNAVVINKVWSIAKTEKGEIGAAGAVYSINVEGGTRAITYNQLNENPRPTFSGVFTAHVYENGNDITSQIKSWYWTTQGHFTGTSIDSSFTPEIKDRFDESVLNNSVTVTAIYNHMPISYTVPIVVSKDLGGLDWVTDWDSTKVSIKDTEVLTPRLFAGEYNPNSDTINGVAIGTDVLNDGQVQGITGYQNNKVSFLLATDGSLLIGNPFEDNGTGLSYNRGRFVLNVDEMAIAGGAVPTWDDMETQLEHHSKDIINAIQDNIDSMNESLNDMTTFVDTILQDELITTLEKVQLDALFQTVTQEVNNIQAQYDSVISNPYLADEDVRNLEKCHVDYMNAYSNIVDVYNDVFGEPVVEEVEYTTPQEEYLMTDDFILEAVDAVDDNEALDENVEEQPVMLADENVDLNPFMLDTLTTQDGYIIVTKDGQPIQMVTENTLLDFSHAVNILREYSSILQQAISEALLSISENRASQMVEEAKEEVRAEIADVDSALNDLETTMNGSFKTGLIGEQSKAILNERLTQLSIEKKDIDGQYEVLSQNTVLSSSNKQTLGTAKDELDAAHDLLVSKINQVIIDNLLTNAELQAVNNLISEYANKLQAYSKVAQECNALIAQTYANAAVAAITDEDVFNKVTNYGALQGLFLKDEKVYINSEYINTRNFKAVTDDGKETFKIDENGEVSITAKSLAITGSSNLATQDYVNTQIENLTNTNITFTLSNEFQIIPTDESYYPLNEGTYAIKVTGYKGSSEEITDFTIGTVTSNDSGIIPVVSNINKTIVLSVSPDAPLSDSNGYVDIPITYDNRQFNKRWSWAVSKQGNQATYVTITGEQFFKYTNNYTGTPTPSQIVLTANVFNSTEAGKWQYNDNGAWVDWKDANGNVITDRNITIKHTSPTLHATNSVFLRYYVDSVFDTYTVARISDGANGNDAQYVTVTGGQTFKYSDNYTGTPTPSTITLTATAHNIDNPTYQWSYKRDGDTSWANITGATNSQYTLSHNNTTIFTQGTTVVTLKCTVNSTLTDEITIAKLTDGKQGVDGKSVISITEQYYLSTSQQTLIGGSWQDTAPTWTKEYYIWTKTIFTYSDNTTLETTPICVTGKDGADGLNGGVSVSSVDIFYYQSTSSTELTGGTWSTDAPTWVSGKYIWSKTITYLDNNTSYESNAVCITGEKGTDGKDGIDGAKGEDGTSYYFYIRYSANADGSNMTNIPQSDTEYMGVCSTTLTEAPTSSSAYDWTLIKGADGQKGQDGVSGEDGKDGTSSFLHVKYSDDGGVTFTANNGETLGKWIGTYVDYTEADSNTTSKYTWAKFIGEDGKDGKDGTSVTIKGTYTAQEWESINQSLIANAISGDGYIVDGDLYVFDGTQFTNCGRIKGEDGKDGTNGTSSFLHIKYSNDNGQTFTNNNGEDIGTYIGTYVDNTKEDSTVLSDYKWTKFVGDNGADAYTVLLTNENHTFAASSTGNIGSTISTTTTVIAYKGTTPITPTIGTLPTVKGLTLSKSGTTITIKASVGTSMAESGSINIPITVDGKSFTKVFSYSKARQGANGANAKLVTVSGEQVFKYANNFTGKPTPETIILKATVANTTEQGKWQYMDTDGTWTDYTKSGNLVTSKTIDILHNSKIFGTTDAKSMRLRYYISDSLYDEITLVKVSDGAKGTDGKNGIDGTNGKDGVSTYFYVRYSANANGSNMTSTPSSSSLYMGVCSTTSATAPTSASSYKWTLIKGSDGKDGIAGAKGDNGQTSYLHIKYSNDGKTFTSNNGEDLGKWIGTYVDFNKADSTSFSSYTWRKYVGEDGQDGTDGTDGTDAYTIILTNEAQTIPTNSSRVPLSSATYSTDIVVYQGTAKRTDFTLGTIKSANGITVAKPSGSKVNFTVSTGTALSADNGTFTIPITIDGKTFNKVFSWSCSKQGNKGDKGDNGADAMAVYITGEQVFKYSNNFTGTPTPETIPLTVTKINTTASGKWQYMDEKSAWQDFTQGGTLQTGDTLNVSHNSKIFGTTPSKSMRVRFYISDSIYDEMTLIKVSDGAKGSSGKDSYTVVLTNENHSFLAGNSGNISTETSATTKVYAYKGATPVAFTLGTITAPTGMTITNNLASGGRTITFTVATGTSLANSGTIDIPVIVDGTTYTKAFSWSKALKGANGNAGNDAYTVLLTNENHTFVANHLGVTAEQIVTTDVIAYKGATPITPTIGTLPSVTGLTLAKSGVRITIKTKANVSTLADSGSFNIPITVDGKSFTKSFSWTKVKDGQKGENGQPGTNGTNGTNAKSVDILASNMVFKSADGGTTFTPDTIKLTAKYQNLTHSKWQYSIDGGTTWANVYDSNNGGWQGGITATSDSLTITIPKTCTLFTDTVTSVVFKVISTDTSFYDVITITKLHDVTDLEVGGTNLVINSDFFMGKRTNWEYSSAWTIHKTEKYKDKYIIYSSRTGLTSDSWAELRSNKIKAKEGETFTMSVDIKWQDVPSTEGFPIAIWGYDDNGANRKTIKSKTVDGSQDWHRFVLTGTVPAGVTHVRACISQKRNGSIYATNFKIERGNVPTDWSPAPQDTTTEIKDKVNTLDKSLNQKAIFNRLTNNGTSQGIYLEDGQLYINGEYINSKNFSSVDNKGNQTFLIDSNGNVHINANTFSLSGKGVPTSQEVLDMISEYGQAENLLLKPNFNDGNLTNWNYSVSAYLSVDASRKHEDSASLKLNYTGSSNAVMVDTSAMRITKYEAGKTYKVGMWIYVEDKTKLKGNLVFSASGIPAGSTSSKIIDSITLTSTNLKNNKWIQFTFDFTPTVDHTSPSIRINCSSGVVAWVTDFTLQEQGGMGQQQMVDILNGAGDGLYLVDGKLLINAEYIQTGTLAADLIQVRVDETTNLLPFNYVTMDNAINDDDFHISKNVNGIPFAECDLPIYSGGGGVDCAIIPLGYSNVTVKSGKSYWFSCEYYAYWGNDTKPEDGKGTSTATSGSKVGLGTGDNLNIVLYDGTNASNMKTDGYIELASVKDFNASVKIVEREEYAGVYTRTWTRLVGRIDNPANYSGKLYVHLDCSGFEPGDYGYFYLRNLQLTDASVADESISLDYITQVKEKRIELTDSSSYYSNILGVDGISLKNGVMSANYDYAGTSYTIDQDGFRYNVIDGSSVFSGESTSYHSYDAGSSGMITGYDTIFGIGGVRQVGGNREGIFIGVHEGFQVPNSTEYGRADIYTHANYDTALDAYTDWELLGQKIEPLGLVRRDDYCNITTQSCLCITHSTSTGGETYNGTTVFSEVMYKRVGNGQLINVKPSDNKIYLSNPKTNTYIETKGALMISDSQYGARQALVNGIQSGDPQINIYTGNNIDIWADRDCSTTIERVWIGSGNNAITITSSGTEQSNTKVKYNSKIMYHEGYKQTSTSDVRYKRAVSDVNTSDCYDMVKNTQLHHYLLLDDTDELRACSEDGIDELETELDTGYSRKVQMGIIAQDVLKYECGKYFVVQDIVKDDDGNITSDKYSIDAYNYASAILGGLQEEIKVRDEQYEELKKENEDLKARLEKLEKLILKGE